jgi:hypothetical protein
LNTETSTQRPSLRLLRTGTPDDRTKPANSLKQVNTATGMFELEIDYYSRGYGDMPVISSIFWQLEKYQ